ncbi:MAG: glycosyltransferase family 4 protein [Beijerinckiaceae bacterium]
MHILIVADHAWINGGQSKVAIESALGLAGRGHRVTYFAAVGPADKRLEKAGISVVCMEQYDISTAPSAAAFFKQYMWNRPAAAKLAEVLAGMDRKDSVVHVHAFAKAVSPSIGPVLVNTQVPVLYTMHEFFLVCPNGGFYDYQTAQTCQRTPLSLSCIATNCDSRSYKHKAMRVARQVLINRGGLHKAFKNIVMISELQQSVSQPFIRPDAHYFRVGNPVDVADPGSKSRIGSDFLFVGRISREKGIEHFCESARISGISPVIAGDGPMLEELKQRYPEARFLGWQKPEAVQALLRQARALVFPSVWYEGQPLTVIESLAMGTPVIVSDVCAGREAITDGRNGLWFKSADEADLARALTRLSDDGEAARMTRNAHADYWANPLSLNRHLDAIEAVYATLLGRDSGAALQAQVADMRREPAAAI